MTTHPFYADDIPQVTYEGILSHSYYLLLGETEELQSMIKRAAASMSVEDADKVRDKLRKIEARLIAARAVAANFERDYPEGSGR